MNYDFFEWYFYGRCFLLLYHFTLWLIRPDMPLRHGLCRVPAFASIALRQPPAAALPIPRMSPEKIPPWIFSGLQNCVAILHALSRHPWLFTGGKYERKKSLHGFSRDCRSASHFCKLLSRHPWLFTGWQVLGKNPSLDFSLDWGCPINSLHSVIPNLFRNLYAICNVDAEIGCKQLRSA